MRDRIPTRVDSEITMMTRECGIVFCSASLSVFLSVFLVVPAFSLQVDARETEILDLSIKGTKLNYSSTGLPSSAEGIVYFRGGPRDGEVAGSYTESLTPVLDPELGLAGTKGVSVFKFPRKVGEQELVDELTTHNDSSIVGEIPTRDVLLVESTGRVTSGSGRFSYANGRLFTSSRVRLGAAFLMDVRLRIVLEDKADVGQESRAEGFRKRVSDYHVYSVRNAWGNAGPELRIILNADGDSVVRYAPEFRKTLLNRMLSAESSVSSEELSGRTAVGKGLLDRWRVQGQMIRTLAGRMKGKGKPTPAVRQRSFEEKLGVVLRAASFQGSELDAFLGKEGVKKVQLEEWRGAIEAAIAKGFESGSPQPTSGTNLLEGLKSRVQSILEEKKARPED